MSMKIGIMMQQINNKTHLRSKALHPLSKTPHLSHMTQLETMIQHLGVSSGKILMFGLLVDMLAIVAPNGTKIKTNSHNIGVLTFRTDKAVLLLSMAIRILARHSPSLTEVLVIGRMSDQILAQMTPGRSN